jgi:hypothetical protein
MKRYVILFAVFALAVCAAIASFNYRVDPYSIYRFEDADEQSLGRIDQFYHLRLTKPWLVAQLKPVAVIAGTSRSATLHPVHPTWPERGSYNLAIPGQTIYELRRFIEHAHAVGPLEKLMIGLDFEAFIQPEPQVKSGFEEARLARHAEDLGSAEFYWRGLNDIRDTLLSIDGLNHSLAAIMGTAKVGRRYYRDGTWESTNTFFTGQGGYIFFGKENVLALRAQQLDLDANLKVLADILRFAHQQNIETRLFITPEHIFIIDLWMRLGYGELWNEFHRGLIAVNNAVAEEMGVQPFPLYGFNQMPGVVNEPIRRARKAEQSLFTDGSHFRPALGAQIMTGVWTDGSGIGARLDADTVDSYLSEIERLRLEFERENAKVTAMLRREISPELD